MFIENFIDHKRMEPMVYHCGKDEGLRPGVEYGPVVRDVFVAECNTDGYGSVVINGREYTVTPGCCYFLFPGDTVTHTADTVKPREGYWCAIDGLQVGAALQKAGISSENPFAPPELFPEIREILKKIYEQREDKDAGADYRRTACVYNLFGVLLRESSVGDTDARIQKAIGYMEANYPFEVSVSDIAREIGLERSYFSTCFKTVTGISPHAYLTSLRIKKAVSFLREGKLSVFEIADAVGIDSQNFSKMFKKATGKSPREYSKYLKSEGNSDETKN